MLELNSELEIIQTACPLFVQLVEVGWIDRNDEVTVKTAERYLENMKKAGVDTIILGCTHFPAIKDIIADVMGKGVTLINSGEQAALKAAEHLRRCDALGTGGNRKFFVSDRVQSFSEIAGILLGSDIGDNVEQINIEGY
jgi:glutamate racemase